MPPRTVDDVERQERRQASWRCYDHSHRDERNTKTKTRMACLRARLATLPEEEQEARRDARRASDLRYRARFVRSPFPFFLRGMINYVGTP
jgi:hypothetical protein